jgi:transposase
VLKTDELYDTDLTDEAWALVAPILPAARPGGRPRTTNLRAVIKHVEAETITVRGSGTDCVPGKSA